MIEKFSQWLGDKGKRLPIVFAILLSIGAMVLNVVNMNSQVALWIALGCLFIQMALYEIDLYNQKNTLPNVLPEQVERNNAQTTIRHFKWPEPTGLSSGTTNSTTDSITTIHDPNIRYLSSGDSFERYYVPFRNVPSRGNIRDAEDVHAILTFSFGKKTISHEKPRWVGKPTPDKPQEDIVIKANGKPEGLYLVIRKQGEKALFVFSDDSYTNNEFQPLKDTLRLSGEDCLVGVRLRDKHGWQQDYFILIRMKDDEPTFKVMPVSGRD